MTIEQMQRLSELTTAASQKNDIATLKKIKTIIDQNVALDVLEFTGDVINVDVVGVGVQF